MITILTIALMTVATVGALLAGSSLGRLFTADAEARWGEVDIEGRALGNSVVGDEVARALAVKARPTAHAVAPRLVLPAVMHVAGHSIDDGEVLGVGPEEDGFAPLRLVAGAASLDALTADGAVLNARAATRLHASVGSFVELVVGAPRWTEQRNGRATAVVHEARTVTLRVRVLAIAADQGVADLGRTANLIVSRDVLQKATGLVPVRSTVIHFALGGVGRADAERLIDTLKADADQLGVSLTPVRADALDIADGEGGLFRSILGFLAVLVVIAAGAAVVQQLTALALDRADEVAALRALGVTRNRVGRLLRAESLSYGVIGAALGTLGAVPLGHALARGLSDHFADLASDLGHEQVALPSTVSPTVVAIGVVIVLAAVILAARRAARRVTSIDADALLRGSREPGRLERSGRTVAVLGLSAAFVLGAGAATGIAAALYLGLTLALLAYVRRGQGLAARISETRTALLGLAWSVLGAAAFTAMAPGVQAGFGVIAVAGLLSVGCAAALIVPRAPVLMSWVRTYARRGGSQAALAIAGRQAASNRTRSTTSIVVVGGAFFIVAALNVLGSAQAVSPRLQSGGFDVIATTTVGVDPTTLRSVPGAAAVVGTAATFVDEQDYRTEDATGARSAVPYAIRLAVPSANLIQAQRFTLFAHEAAYPTAAAALQAALIDGDKAVLDRYSLPEGARVGDDVVIEQGGVEHSFRLIAVLDTFITNAVFIGQKPFDLIVGSHGATLLLASASPGVSAEQLAQSLTVAGAPHGLKVRTVQRAAAQVVSINRTFTDLFALMVVLGLAVAVVETASATARATKERAGQLRMLHALGLRRREITLMLAAEPTVTALAGALAGLASGLVVLRLLFAWGYGDFAFIVDVRSLGLVVLGACALLIVSSWAAARFSWKRHVQ